MDIYQPLLFVGLGGTGCKVGAELERRLREALCGPDGTELQARLGAEFLPYRLPSCLQFVYADLSAFELEQTRRKASPGGEHDDAAQRTRHLITNLIPNDLHNSGQVGQRLRTYLGSDVIGWLPSQESDPNVAPLIDGAGQFPTVARAVLFESMRRSQDIVLGGLTSAMTAINRCGGEIAPLGGRLGGSLKHLA
jgi:Tubulin like